MNTPSEINGERFENIHALLELNFKGCVLYCERRLEGCIPAVIWRS
jgi:hypothetical protein